METIYSSKLYKAKSKRAKEKINAALADPINAPLVKQLEEYLDDQYKPFAVQPKIKDTEVTENKTKPSNTNIPSPSISNIPSGAGSVDLPDSDFDGELSEDEETSELEDTEELTDIDNSVSKLSEDEEAEKVKSNTAVKAQTYFDIGNVITNDPNIEHLPEEIKGTLNSVEATKGVARVTIKDSELWIYYKDDVNLNNVMEEVIYRLNAASYYYLIFNRLARTDNAMVFDLNVLDSEAKVHTIEELENKKE